ncbi:hypothetical protein WICPIJ_005679 [Wickerhamomyces pijperi]|uniref:Uncharacterized protein n=1 Tax=Wickerhamomyces pijperi TaxID=599730 RepID=A0A9P8TLL4_WICPI|nr:hypothetical protein WICPIJ_005679 [Wickerhamomyces pijperi]
MFNLEIAELVLTKLEAPFNPVPCALVEDSDVRILMRRWMWLCDSKVASKRGGTVVMIRFCLGKAEFLNVYR